MNKHNLFWGALLILAGVLFLGNNLNWFSIQPQVIFPIVLISLGLYTLLSRHWPVEEQASDFNIPLDGAKQASLVLQHGAGKIRLAGGGSAANLLSGRSAGLSHKAQRQGDLLKVKIATAFGSLESLFPWNWGLGHRDWQLQLNPQIPTTLKVESGASETNLDLRKTKVTDLKIETGASSTHITMPEAAGLTRAKISGGAASFKIVVPKGVAASITIESGLGSVEVDEARFPFSGKIYQSADYAAATHKLDLEIEAGVSSIHIE